MQQQKLKLGFVFLLIFLVSCTQKIDGYCDENKTISRIKLCSFDNYSCTMICEYENQTLYYKTNITSDIKEIVAPCVFAVMSGVQDVGEGKCRVYCPEAKFVGYNC